MSQRGETKQASQTEVRKSISGLFFMLNKETAKGQSKVSPSMRKFIVALKDFSGKILRNQLRQADS